VSLPVPIRQCSCTHRYKDFTRDYPNGRLNKEEFRRFHQRFFPYGDPGQFAEYFFNVFDTDNNGEINFKEFICPLSLTLRGDPDEKLKCTYPSFPSILHVVPRYGGTSSDGSAPSLILTPICSP
jgi:Ca2+-binding EF-hand superfamily protein